MTCGVMGQKDWDEYLIEKPDVLAVVYKSAADYSAQFKFTELSLEESSSNLLRMTEGKK